MNFRDICGVLLAGIASLASAAWPQTLKVVNIVPPGRQAENAHDQEPSLSVNPLNPRQIVAMAMSTDLPEYVQGGPVYYSDNGGDTWSYVLATPPLRAALYAYADATISFNRASPPTLYASIMEAQTAGHAVLRILQGPFPPARSSMRPQTLPAAWAVDRVDQPQIAAVRKGTSDLIYVGLSDPTVLPPAQNRSITMMKRVSQGAFNRAVIDRKTPPANNASRGAPVRVAIVPDARTYAIFLARRLGQQVKTNTGNVINYQADVMLVSDPVSSTNPPPFGNSVGVRIAGTTIRDGIFLGNDRAGPDVAFAIHPNPARKLACAAWGGLTGSTYRLHLRVSNTGGDTWPATDQLIVDNAKNPALSINSAGQVAFVYQQLVSGRWETRIQIFNTSPSGALVSPSFFNRLLSSWQDGSLGDIWPPVLGDYIQLTSVDKNFYGIFSASNAGQFPPELTQLRQKPNGPSIDPYFFRVTFP